MPLTSIVHLICPSLARYVQEEYLTATLTLTLRSCTICSTAACPSVDWPCINKLCMFICWAASNGFSCKPGWLYCTAARQKMEQKHVVRQPFSYILNYSKEECKISAAFFSSTLLFSIQPLIWTFYFKNLLHTITFISTNRNYSFISYSTYYVNTLTFILQISWILVYHHNLRTSSGFFLSSYGRGAKFMREIGIAKTWKMATKAVFNC